GQCNELIVLACAYALCSLARCFLAAAMSSNNGNFLDNDQWLSTVSQYDRDKYWNKFRDVSTVCLEFFKPLLSDICFLFRVCLTGGGEEREMALSEQVATACSLEGKR
uniref:Uncharacterized protein n=1 Tax=Salvator merianae TaxID=96440 RepID=A0A8D0DVC6_SALMN